MCKSSIDYITGNKETETARTPYGLHTCLAYLRYIPSMLFAILGGFNVSSPLSNRVSSKSREPEILRDKKTPKFFRALKPMISLMKINPTMTSSCILALHLIYVQILVRKFILLLDEGNY